MTKKHGKKYKVLAFYQVTKIPQKDPRQKREHPWEYNEKLISKATVLREEKGKKIVKFRKKDPFGRKPHKYGQELQSYYPQFKKYHIEEQDMFIPTKIPKKQTRLTKWASPKHTKKPKKRTKSRSQKVKKR